MAVTMATAFIQHLQIKKTMCFPFRWAFFSARRYGESILTVSLRGLNNMIPFAGCTVRAESQIKLVWWDTSQYQCSRFNIMFNNRTWKTCFSSSPRRTWGVVGRNIKKLRRAPGKEFSILITQRQTKSTRKADKWKSRCVGCVTTCRLYSTRNSFGLFGHFWMILITTF